MTYETGDAVEVSTDERGTWMPGTYVMPSTSIDGAHCVYVDPHGSIVVLDENIRMSTGLGGTTKCPSCAQSRKSDVPFVVCSMCSAFVCFSCSGNASRPAGRDDCRWAYVCRACTKSARNATILIDWDARGYPKARVT